MSDYMGRVAKIVVSSPVKGKTPHSFQSWFKDGKWYEVDIRDSKDPLPVSACVDGIILESKEGYLVFANYNLNVKIILKNITSQFYDQGTKIKKDQVIALTYPKRALIMYVQDTNSEAYVEALFTP